MFTLKQEKDGELKLLDQCKWESIAKKIWGNERWTSIIH